MIKTTICGKAISINFILTSSKLCLKEINRHYVSLHHHFCSDITWNQCFFQVSIICAQHVAQAWSHKNSRWCKNTTSTAFMWLYYRSMSEMKHTILCKLWISWTGYSMVLQDFEKNCMCSMILSNILILKIMYI